MKWHYVKDEGFPKWYAEIIVKCEDGEVLKTGYSSYDDEDYHKKIICSVYVCADSGISHS